ncbi:RsmB/NOP family class I SAM-dependent RNA methyltransferase [Patescibacteria group bacterium]|nr:RsmB/NOP family class I SAM-dependent RNA methyltransferase [Patescibacteria group bacterium]
MSKKKKSKQYTYISEKFYERLAEMFGVSLLSQIKETFVERPTTFRVNTIKADKAEVRENLFKNGFKFKDVSWYKDAFILSNKNKKELMKLGIYKNGEIYIQSLASMVPPLVLDPKPGEKVLDLTAAPGGKTSQIAGLMGCEGELMANDNNEVRFARLKHNMEVLAVIPSESELARGRIEGSLSEAEKRDFSSTYVGARNDNWRVSLRMENGSTLCKEFPNYFDRILLDAPCTAETRFIADKPKTFSYWNERKIKEMAYKQRQLLFSAWGALKPGGTLVYSTCTFAPEENELQISKFLERNSDAEVVSIDTLGDINKLPIVKVWKDSEIHPEVVKKALRIMPNKEIEGFFVAKLRKKH